MDIIWGSFVWDEKKEAENILKHFVDFKTAALVFLDPERRVIDDSKHSRFEERMFCLGKIGGRILTVRYTQRTDMIRIIGAGYWRGGRKNYYEKEIH